MRAFFGADPPSPPCRCLCTAMPTQKIPSGRLIRDELHPGISNVTVCEIFRLGVLSNKSPKDATPSFLFALRHAPLCVAKWSHRNVSEDTHACPSIPYALSSAHTVSWPHPQATLHSVCAHGPGFRDPVTSRATPADHLHTWASTQDEHFDPLLPPSTL